MKKIWKLSGTIALGLALLIMLIALACAPEEAIPRSYSCAVYTEQGCAKFVVASGGEIEIQSGGTFDLQSGATVDFSGGVDLDGSTLTMDEDGDTSLVASQDDVITATITDTTYLVIANGNLKVGDGSPSTAQDGEDAYVEGGFEVDGTARLDGVATLSNGTAGAPGLAFTADTDSGIYRIGANNIGVAVSATLISDWSSASMDMNNVPIVNMGAAGTDFGSDGSLTTAQGITVTAGDVNLTDESTGGQAGAKNEFIGLPRIKMVALGTMTNGSTESVNYVDDTPDGEWTAIDADCTVSADATYYRVGSKSLKLAFADTAEDDDGATNDIVNDNLEANESIGFWIYSDTALDAGDLDILIDDDNADPDQSYDVCAVSTVNQWTWCEVDISALAGGNGDVVDKIGIVLKDAAGLGAFNVYFDLMWKWDADDEEALSAAVVQDGVLSVMTITTAQDQANTPAMLTGDSDFLVHYESGNDFIVTLTDQSANSGVALIAY